MVRCPVGVTDVFKVGVGLHLLVCFGEQVDKLDQAGVSMDWLQMTYFAVRIWSMSKRVWGGVMLWRRVE